MKSSKLSLEAGECRAPGTRGDVSAELHHQRREGQLVIWPRQERERGDVWALIYSEPGGGAAGIPVPSAN